MTRCRYQVMAGNERFAQTRQCKRDAVKDGFCKQHSTAALDSRAKQHRDCAALRRAKWLLERTGPAYYEACKDIPIPNKFETITDYDKRALAWFWTNASKIHAANKRAQGL